MKKILLIIATLIFSTSVFAHSTNIDFDSRANCSKKKSMLTGISKLKGYRGGECASKLVENKIANRIRTNFFILNTLFFLIV